MATPDRYGSMSAASTAFLESAIRTATPLALAAFGEVVVERAGIINVSLEGIILAGSFGALLATPDALTIGASGAVFEDIAQPSNTKARTKSAAENIVAFFIRFSSAEECVPSTECLIT